MTPPEPLPRPENVGRRDIWTFGGVPLAVDSPDQAACRLLDKLNDRQTKTKTDSYRLLNAYSFALAESDARYRALLQDSGTNFVDGTPLSWVGRAFGRAHSAVRGPTLMLETLTRGVALEAKHFFLGGEDETLRLLRDRLEKIAPGLNIVGTFSPPFRPMTPEETGDQDAYIAACNPDIIWVGLGTPRQDFEVARIHQELGITSVAVGAAFDFLAGTKAEAPRAIQNSGFEWVFRLVTEPRRLWRRYLFGNLLFLRRAVGELVHAYRHRP